VSEPSALEMMSFGIFRGELGVGRSLAN
jgi:hypothetical protein